MHQDSGERSSDPTRDVGQRWPAAGLGPWDRLKEVTIIFITSTLVWPQVNNWEGTQPRPSTKNWIKDLLSKPPTPSRTRPSFRLSLSYQEKEMATHSSTLAWKIPWKGDWWATVESDTTERLHFHFLPSGSFLSSIRGQTTENHNHRKLTNLITWTAALSNSVKL